jgi:dTDP-4-dehydrorhamnose reductase
MEGKKMTDQAKRRPLEWWGGVEPTINRVGDRYFSQLERNGHRTRPSDLDAFAQLGLRRLRFPILWEELVPGSSDHVKWSIVDAPLERVRALGMAPIAGLVHHGSGPRFTSLIDPQFPEKLAHYARQVAERYPWIDAYTPVNEPLTTARFSGLYGHWYPHGRDGFTFGRALLNQCRGVVLAMRAIRSINPDAALIQTDDLGKTFASPRLSYQADFENERRWLTWDLLSGRVDHAHPMWSYLLWLGLEERDVAFFAENPCPPQVIGVNYYVTSERYLDENLRDHPPEMHGGNGRERYADVAAVRVRAEGIAGPEKLLREACARYDLPIAITEVHLGCTRDEQLRWLNQVWEAARTLHEEGLNVCAVTAWSLLGSFDWNNLLTRDENSYEPGAFDVRSGSPRATAVGRMIRSLANGKQFEHPVLGSRGWWERPIRFIEPVRERLAVNSRDICPATDSVQIFHYSNVVETTRCERRILLTGASGGLGERFKRVAQMRALAVRAVGHPELDITDGNRVRDLIAAERPWVVINCAGFTDVDAAEADEESCLAVNVHGAETLAKVCAQYDIPLVTFSSDHVFGGDHEHAFAESNACDPLNAYGRSKRLAEEKVLTAHQHSLVVRLGKLLTADEHRDSLRARLNALAHGEPARVANDVRFSISYLPDVVQAVLDLLIDAERGLWHLVNAGSVTPEELLVSLADLAHLDTSLIERVPLWSLQHAAPRARNRALRSERGQLLPPLESALHRYLQEGPAIVVESGQVLAAR